MGWYIAILVLLLIAIGELATEIERLKEQLQETNLTLLKVVVKQQQDEVENE